MLSNNNNNNKNINRIPKGIYCYDENGICPFWSIRPNKEKQNNGYCSYLNIGDWNLSFGLLWDQVKECDKNLDD
jgi:hypothetical protein